MASTAEDARSDKSGTRSVRSSGSRKYKVVSRGSDVDESLFGDSSKPNPGNSGQQNTSAKKIPMANIPPKATVITKNELARMKQRAIITSLVDEKAEQLAREKDLEEKQKEARDRKQRMLEMEVEAKNKALKSDIEIEQLARDAIVRRLATEKLDDNNDMVKLINSLGASAAAFMIRDEQLEEKKKHQKLEKDYEERMDMIMELDRLKDLTMRDAQEQERKKKRIEDRKAITEQIEARRRDNLIRLEAREQENQAMLAAMKRYAEADKAAAEKRAVEMRKARELVMAANEGAIHKRKAAREKEKEEVEAVLAYQAMKDEEMRLREVAEAEKKQMMKNRQQKLLDGQKRDMDKRAEIDELRARRAAEEKEREMRRREQDSAEKRRRDTLQLQADRRRQADSKKAHLAREADLEKEEYDAVLRHKAKLAERERREDEAKHAANMEHRRAILQQMQDAEDKRKAERIAKIEEGRRCKQERIKEHVKLEAMRDRMVDDLEKRGISPKYLAEMKAVDIPKIIMR